MATTGVDKILASVRAKHRRRVEKRALQLRDIVVNLHSTAPRRGGNVNAFGLKRSAANPPQAPAVEYGTLLARLADNPRPLPDGYRVSVNRLFLEYGTRKMAPRPMGALGLAELRQKVRR